MIADRRPAVAPGYARAAAALLSRPVAGAGFVRYAHPTGVRKDGSGRISRVVHVDAAAMHGVVARAAFAA
jgi:hypothetical protein